MRKAQLIVVASIVSLFVSACAGTSPSDGRAHGEHAEEGPGELHRFTSSAEGFHTHTYYYDTGKEVVVFDAQFTRSAARAVIEDIRERTDSPITHLVITHANPDKFNGANVFRELGAEVIASRQTVEAMPGVHAYKKHYFVEVAGTFTAQTYPELPQVDVTFSGQKTLQLSSGHEVLLRHIDRSAVAPTHTVAHIPSLDALVVGDLIHHGVHAWLEGPIVDGRPRPDLRAWKSALEELDRFEGVVVYGGRGESAPLEEAVAAQMHYLTEVEQIVREHLQGHEGTPDEQTNAAVAGQVIDAFPQYDHNYMVEYSIYGLTNHYARD